MATLNVWDTQSAIQLLWINIITSGLQDLALSFEPAEDDIMDLPPRKTDESIFNKSFIMETLVSGIGISILVFSVWVYLLNHLVLIIHTNAEASPKSFPHGEAFHEQASFVC